MNPRMAGCLPTAQAWEQASSKGPLKFVDSGSVYLRQKQLTLTLHNSISADDAGKI